MWLSPLAPVSEGVYGVYMENTPKETKLTTQTQLTKLLTERLDLWDQIDKAYEDGLIPKAIDLTQMLENDLNPKIKEAYNL